MTNRNDIQDAFRKVGVTVADYIDERIADVRKDLHDNYVTNEHLKQEFSDYVKNNPPRTKAEADQLRSIRSDIAEANAQHDAATDALNSKEGVSPDQVKEAKAATATAKLSWDDWRSHVDSELARHDGILKEHGRDIEALKRDKADKVGVPPTRVIETPTETIVKTPATPVVAETAPQPEPKHHGVEFFEDKTPKANSMFDRTAPATAVAVDTEAETTSRCKWDKVDVIVGLIVGVVIFIFFTPALANALGGPAPAFWRDVIIALAVSVLAFFIAGFLTALARSKSTTTTEVRTEARA